MVKGDKVKTEDGKIGYIDYVYDDKAIIKTEDGFIKRLVDDLEKIEEDETREITAEVFDKAVNDTLKNNKLIEQMRGNSLSAMSIFNTTMTMGIFATELRRALFGDDEDNV